jgi:hypothetical protein
LERADGEGFKNHVSILKGHCSGERLLQIGLVGRECRLAER